ncbi:uncharacterized protein LOC110840005 isoform X2 [Zootermopsis nevadensis]|nr:uncharacterized protein LOC110840005 isoform X2 [Zootermopsis nevadensis]
MFLSFRGASEKKKLEDTQRSLISKTLNEYADRQSFHNQKRVMNIISPNGSSYASAVDTSMANVGKRKPYGYLTLLDISVLGGFSIPERSIVADKEFVPNSFHQRHNESRWTSFVERTPKWILKMGIESLNKERKESTEESFGPRVLQRWTPVLIEPNKLKLTGYLQSNSSREVFHATDIVAARKDFDCVRCHDGTVYKLQGPFVDPKHNIPSPIQQLLRQGLPCKWRMMMENWVKLLADIKKREKEAAKSLVTVTNGFGHYEDTEETDSSDESVVTTPAWPTDKMTRHTKHVENTEYAELNKKHDVNKETAKNSVYRMGSVIPLEKLDGQGIVRTSSRGRVSVPPVRYWLGERLVQQDNQPAFFSPKTGVTEVVVNQRVDSIKYEKKRKKSEPDAVTSTTTKKRRDRNATTRESENTFQTSRKEKITLSHSTYSSWLQKINMRASKTQSTPKGSKEKRNSRPLFSICDSEEDQTDDALLGDMSTNMNSRDFRANNLQSSGSTALPTEINMEDTQLRTDSSGPLLNPDLRKEIQRLIQRQQRSMGRDSNRSLLKPTVGRNDSTLITKKNHGDVVFTVEYNEVEDKASSFEEEELSSSWISTEDKL